MVRRLFELLNSDYKLFRTKLTFFFFVFFFFVFVFFVFFFVCFLGVFSVCLFFYLYLAVLRI